MNTIIPISARPPKSSIKSWPCDCQSWRAARPGKYAVFADVTSDMVDRVRRDGEPPARNNRAACPVVVQLLRQGCSSRSRPQALLPWRRSSHDGDQRFHQHGTVADKAGLVLVFDHLRVVPEEMSAWKPRYRPQAMVMNKKGNNYPRTRGRCVNETSDRRIFRSGLTKTMLTASQNNRSDFKESKDNLSERGAARSVVRSTKSVTNNHQCQAIAAEVKERGEGWILRYCPAEERALLGGGRIR